MMTRSRHAPGALFVELVSSLYTTLIPTSIMSAGYIASFGVMALETRNVVLAAFAMAGVFSSAGRIAVTIGGSAEARDPALSSRRARTLELRFAVAYFQFAALLGVSAAYVFFQDLPRYHMLMMCLLVGYGAGAAVGVGLRPWIAIPAMLIAIIPSIVAMSLHWDFIYWASAAMTAALLAGGCSSLLERFRIASSGIGDRLAFQTLARHDSLTALPNRLALREWFEDNSSVGTNHELIAVHCLDLNNFKPVNDTYGHAAGDELLKVVGARLKQTLRAGDTAARLGGDEFAVIQRNIASTSEALALARRLQKTISEPFEIRNQAVQVSTCIGFAVCHWRSGDLEQLLALADEALYRAKKSVSGIAVASPLTDSSDKARANLEQSDVAA